MRDTLPASPNPNVPPPEATTGMRRRVTQGLESLATDRHDTIEGMPKIAIDDVAAIPKSSPPERRKREALRVDEVRASKVTLRGAAEHRPRVVDRSRVSRAPLESRDAFVIQLIDGTLTMTELSDATGIAEPELDRIVARLVRLGIVAM